MDITKIIYGLLLLVTCALADLSITYAGQRYFPGGQDAVLKCQIDPIPENPQVIKTTWRYNAAGDLAKIGYTQDNATTYYSSSPLDDTKFLMSSDGLEEGQARATIVNFAIDEEGQYECEAEDTSVTFSSSRVFEIGAYYLGDVFMTDLDIELDIRPVSPSESVAETVDENAMASNETTDVMTTTEPTTTTTEDPGDGKTAVVACNANGIYPKPQRIEFTSSKTGNVWEVQEAEFSSSEQNEDMTYNVAATLRITLNADLDGAVFNCKVFIIETDDQRIDSVATNTSSPLVVLHDTNNVMIEFNKMKVLVDDTVIIKCKADGNPPATLTLVTPNGSEYDVTDAPHRFTAQKSGDAGQYVCKASNSEQVVQDSGTLEVEWMDKPDIQDGNFNPVVGTVDANEDEVLSFMCVAAGTSPITYVWSKDGVKLDEGSILTLPSVGYSDGGVYSCEAVGGSGGISDSSEFTLNVKTACIASIQDTTISNSQDSSGNAFVQITCVATGNPTCTMDFEGYSGGVIDKSNNKIVMTIEALPKQVNALEIMCTAYNNIGAMSSKNTTLDKEPACCETATSTAGLGTGVIIIIILLVALVVVGIPVGCYVAKKRKAHSDKAEDEKNAEEGENEKLETNNDDNQA